MGAILTCTAIVIATQEGVAHSQTPTPEQIIEGIKYEWPAELAEYAIALTKCESTLGQDSRTYAEDQIHSGPFQFAVTTWKPYFERMGISWYSVLFDPYINAWAAYHIYRVQGKGAWPNCPNPKYYR